MFSINILAQLYSTITNIILLYILLNILQSYVFLVSFQHSKTSKKAVYNIKTSNSRHLFTLMKLR